MDIYFHGKSIDYPRDGKAPGGTGESQTAPQMLTAPGKRRIVGGGEVEDGQAVAPTGHLAASSVLAPATNSDQWPPVAKHTAAKRSRSALALAAFEVL